MRCNQSEFCSCQGPGCLDTTHFSISRERYFSFSCSPLFISTSLNKKEKLAVEFARLMGTAPKELSADDEFWKELKLSFTDAEITDLTYSIAGWMGMGRVFHVLGMDQNCSV